MIMHYFKRRLAKVLTASDLRVLKRYYPGRSAVLPELLEEGDGE